MAEIVISDPLKVELLEGLYHTRMDAKVRRRRDLGNGNYELYEVTRPTAPFEVTTHPEEFALDRHRVDITAELSPYYLNYRNLPNNLYHLMGLNLAALDGRRSDVAVGIPDAATKIGIAYSEATRLLSVGRNADNKYVPHVPLLEKVKDGGANVLRFAPGAPEGEGQTTVDLIDDVTTTSRSKELAAAVLEDHGYKVRRILVVTDREQGGMEKLRDKGYIAEAVFKFIAQLDYYHSQGYVSDIDYQRSLDYKQRNS